MTDWSQTPGHWLQSGVERVIELVDDSGGVPGDRRQGEDAWRMKQSNVKPAVPVQNSGLTDWSGPLVLQTSCRVSVPERMNKTPPLRATCSLTCSAIRPIFVHLSPRMETMMETRPRIRDKIIRALQACRWAADTDRRISKWALWHPIRHQRGAPGVSEHQRVLGWFSFWWSAGLDSTTFWRILDHGKLRFTHSRGPGPSWTCCTGRTRAPWRRSSSTGLQTAMSWWWPSLPGYAPSKCERT